MQTLKVRPCRNFFDRLARGILAYKSRVLCLDAMVEEGTISPEDPGLFLLTDSVDEAFEYVVGELVKNEAGGAE